MYYQFNIYKWDALGENLLEKRTKTIKRASRASAYDRIYSLYPKSKGYFCELNSTHS